MLNTSINYASPNFAYLCYERMVCCKNKIFSPLFYDDLLQGHVVDELNCHHFQFRVSVGTI